VLNGTIDPLEGRGADHLTIPSLLERLTKQEPPIQEVLIALDADVPGDATTLFLQRTLAMFPHIKISRLARGLPSGASLEYADPLTLMDAITNRKTTEPTNEV
jgi:recombination protein RecR